MGIQIFSASAGSGKTYTLTQEMAKLMEHGGVRPSGIIATTFTKKAAAELLERVAKELLQRGLTEQAQQVSGALIGTVHSIGTQLLTRFAFEAGVSPQVSIIAEEDEQVLFNESLSAIVSMERIEQIEGVVSRFTTEEPLDWRRVVLSICNLIRVNNFEEEVVQQSKQDSIDSFLGYLRPPAPRSVAQWTSRLKELLDETLEALKTHGDGTKITEQVRKLLGDSIRLLRDRSDGMLPWSGWAKLCAMKPGVKSTHLVADLKEFAEGHLAHSQLHHDVRYFIGEMFDIAWEAIKEYSKYKKRRGLIDYTDMECHLYELIQKPDIQDILRHELDLLMVDEFQDTSPLQLAIFLKLSEIAKHAIWVGDPKQSIYSFRGAEPQLMHAVIEKLGGIKPEHILRKSWRSRQDIVWATNAIFTKAFDQLPQEQVALEPVNTPNDDPKELSDALIHWHFQSVERTNAEWLNERVAAQIAQIKEQGYYVRSRSPAKPARPLEYGDIAVLCRTNNECAHIAEALGRRGIKVAMARSGLLQTHEVVLIIACLKYILHSRDTLSIAEILLMATNQTIEDIIFDRLKHLENPPEIRGVWAIQQPIIRQLTDLRRTTGELSSTEIMTLVIEQLDLRRIIATWGNATQRLENVEALRKLAFEYEDRCSRLHSAASLGGMLLWLNDLAAKDRDHQSSGSDKNAVNILTYHKSKGLEWEFTICHQLEKDNKPRIWDAKIIQNNPFQLLKPLANRSIRYWVNPYGRNTPPIQSNIEEGEYYQKIAQQEHEEATRLLYVGITRARDYLVFPTRNINPAWLENVCRNTPKTTEILPKQGKHSNWTWNGTTLPMQIVNVPSPPTDETLQTSPNQTDTPLQWLEPPIGIVQHPKYTPDTTQIAIHTLQTITYEQSPLTTNFTPLQWRVLQQIMINNVHHTATTLPTTRLADTLTHHNITAHISEHKIYATIIQFNQRIAQYFDQYTLQKWFPLPAQTTTPLLADLLLTDPHTHTQHLLCTTFQPFDKHWRTRNSDLIAALIAALIASTHTQSPPPHIWIHSIEQGKIIEINIQ